MIGAVLIGREQHHHYCLGIEVLTKFFKVLVETLDKQSDL